jgi:hypothetical protein
MPDEEKAVTVVPQKVEQVSPRNPVNINYWGRNVDMYYVQDSELDTIGTANSESSLYMGACGISVGIAVALMGILVQVPITDARILAVCWSILVVSIFGSLILGVKALMCHRSARSSITRIKDQSKKQS